MPGDYLDENGTRTTIMMRVVLATATLAAAAPLNPIVGHSSIPGSAWRLQYLISLPEDSSSPLLWLREHSGHGVGAVQVTGVWENVCVLLVA
jgi:hypothetical protein